MLTPTDQLFLRNMEHAGSFHYNLEKVHGDSVAQTLNTISNDLMIDAQSLSITGPGLTKYLDRAGNVLVLIDEFDGDHQKLGLFGTQSKSNNLK
ncbi:unnamed protein product [Rotaria sordida]|uniref:Uncharacterized protein n=1 Tax=Rotaria sordida TaxID=392033 RepID=A0A815QKF5_9BILA|nr:unnamed protein product [Rotaria sordida]